MIIKRCFSLNVIGESESQQIDFEIGENQNGQIAMRVGQYELTEEDFGKLVLNTFACLGESVDTYAELPEDPELGTICVVRYKDSTKTQLVNQPYLYGHEGWLPMGGSGADVEDLKVRVSVLEEEMDEAQQDIVDLNERIDNLPKGIVYRGAVDYKDQLPAVGQTVGDAYSVRYKGTSEQGGTELDGTEYVWTGSDWIPLGPDLQPLEEKVAALEAGKLDKADIYILYGGSATEVRP